MSGAAEIPGLTNLAEVVHAAVRRAADDDDRADEAKSDDNTASKPGSEAAKEDAKDASQQGSPGKAPSERQRSQPNLTIPNGDVSTTQKQHGTDDDDDTASINARRSPQTAPSSPGASTTRILNAPMVDSPSARTGPPRSFSYSFARARAPPSRRASDAGGTGTIPEDGEVAPDENAVDDDSEGEGYGYGYDYETHLEEIAESSSSASSSAAGTPKPPRAVPRTRSEFRGALEYIDPEQREKEREARERREKSRLSRLNEGASMNPLKWLSGSVDSGMTHESPKEDSGDGWTSYFEGFFKGADKNREKETPRQEDGDAHVPDGDAEKQQPKQEDLDKRADKSKEGKASKTSLGKQPAERSYSHHQETSTPTSEKRKGLVRAQSMPHIKRQSSRRSSQAQTAPRWARLRTLLPLIAARQQPAAAGEPDQMAAVQTHLVPITDELVFSGLDSLMLKLWFERDEGGNRRVPVLLNQLRVRISDSIHPMSRNKAVFRIECEYARARWVVYRRLGDFIKLHSRYYFSNAFSRTGNILPEFPRTSKYSVL